MSGDEPDNLVLRMLRRMDEKLDRLLADVAELKPRLTLLGRQVGDLPMDMAGLSARLDRVNGRLDRLERRAELTP